MNLTRTDLALAAGLAVALFALLCVTAPDVGITRDESVYFDAGERYAAWFTDLVDAPGKALSEPGIRRRFELNREHPGLPKILFGLSHALFTDTLGWTGHRLGFRLPAFAFGGLLLATLYLLGAGVAGRSAGLLAALFGVLLPRHFHHLHLASFDVAATAGWALTVLAWQRARAAPDRWGPAILCGLAFGLAISVKHNAYFLPPLLVLHWLVFHGRRAFRAGGWKARLAQVPRALWAMAVLGPICLFVSWPWLWHAPFERFGWYLGFHLHHEHYSWHYLGEVLRQPPFPWSYPLVVTALTSPLPSLGLMALGLGFAGWRSWRALRGGVAARSHPEVEGVTLWALNALVPILLIAQPSVPIFGGVKHWMHGVVFLGLLGAWALTRLIAAAELPAPARRVVPGLLAVAIVLPSATEAGHVHPYGTSSYSDLAGGVPGAAELGMQRQYWSAAVTGVLPWVNAHVKQGKRVYLHEVTRSAFRWYQAEGLLREDLRPAWSVEAADVTAYQFHQEFRDAEFRCWTAYGSRRPRTQLLLDGVPLIRVYARDDAVDDGGGERR